MSIIEGENYQVDFQTDSHTLVISGTLRLRGMEEYLPITDILMQEISKSQQLKLDLCNLKFLNSSGIAMLSKMVITARKKEGFTLSITGSDSIPWQKKSLANLQRLMPDLKLSFA